MKAQTAAQKGGPTTNSLLPGKYADPQKTPFQATVPSKEELRFEVKE